MHSVCTAAFAAAIVGPLSAVVPLPADAAGLRTLTDDLSKGKP